MSVQQSKRRCSATVKCDELWGVEILEQSEGRQINILLDLYQDLPVLLNL